MRRLLGVLVALATAACHSTSLGIADRDAGDTVSLLPADGLSDIVRIRVGDAVPVDAVLFHRPTGGDGPSSSPAVTLVADDGAVLGVVPTSEGAFTLQGLALGETVVHGASADRYEADLSVRVVPR